MRGVVPKVKKQMGLKKKMNRLLFSTMIPMACLLVILLLIFWQYAGQYNKLSENLAVSSKFNLSFKDELDLEMYYLAIGSKEASLSVCIFQNVFQHCSKFRKVCVCRYQTASPYRRFCSFSCNF